MILANYEVEIKKNEFNIKLGCVFVPFCAAKGCKLSLHFAFRNIALKTFHSQGGWILLAIQNRRRREEESKRGRARKEHLIASDDFVLVNKGLSITVEGCKLVRVVLFF